MALGKVAVHIRRWEGIIERVGDVHPGGGGGGLEEEHLGRVFALRFHVVAEVGEDSAVDAARIYGGDVKGLEFGLAECHLVFAAVGFGEVEHEFVMYGLVEDLNAVCLWILALMVI